MPITIDTLLDTNILLRMPFDQTGALTNASLAYMKLAEMGFSLGTTVSNIAEFANTATRTLAENGLGLSTSNTQQRIHALEDQLTVFSESLASYEIWKQLVAKYQVRGKQVHDTRIVAIMMKEGIRSILTFNTSDFARFPEITTLHPSDVLNRA